MPGFVRVVLGALVGGLAGALVVAPLGLALEVALGDQEFREWGFSFTLLLVGLAGGIVGVVAGAIVGGLLTAVARGRLTMDGFLAWSLATTVMWSAPIAATSIGARVAGQQDVLTFVAVGAWIVMIMVFVWALGRRVIARRLLRSGTAV